MEPVDVSVVHFEAEDGTRLEGDLLAPADATGTAVVCHPHPLYGGSRQDAVVAALTRAFVGCGRRVLRFDFRGTGGSQGTHDGGAAERTDLMAAIDALDPGDGPLTIAGYSFGADVALSVAHPAATSWIVVAPPLAIIAPEDMLAPTDGRPVTVITGEHDQFNPPPQLGPRLEGWSNAELHVIDTADHFFAGSHQALSEIAASALVS
ncbi:MAG: alpha/beta hydrolase [Acidimicrobiales bacterium]|nr:MAG: alpha/beta hydrolase [Acidimicrobiales bacterium]